MRKRCLVLLTVVLLCFSALAGCQSNQESTETTLRVATWNIDSKAHPDIKAMSDILHDHEIEIMGFQEIDINNSRNDYDMAQDFVNDNYPYVHFAKGRDFADGYFGVGTTSMYELQEISSIPIESTGSRATKTLERVVFEKDGKTIAFYVTHTSWENNDLRRRQFTEIIERIASDPAPYKILVADFNADQSLYEYDIFKDNFNVANGKDGVWFDTFTGEDDTMKVMTVDNIITTKNIEITNVESYHSDMADHDLLYADLILKDEAAETVEHDRALGQDVQATATAEDSHPYNMVDFDDNTYWQSTDEAQQVLLTLDRPYQAEKLNLVWGQQHPQDYTVEVSLDGTTFITVGTYDADQTEVALSGAVKYVRLGLDAVEGGSQIATLSLWGDWITPTVTSSANLLTNGTMDAPEGWALENYTTEGNAAYQYAISDGVLALTKTGSDAGDAAVTQTIAIQPNERYQLSFRHHTDQLHSGNFCYEIDQLDAEGNSIATHHARLTNNLNMSETFRRFDYNFITAANAASVKISLHVVGEGEGTLWLDDVSVREVVPTESVFLSASAVTLKAGETTTITPVIVPETADDVTFHWVSQDESVAVVDESGVVTAKAAGKTLVGLVSDSDLVAESYLLITVE